MPIITLKAKKIRFLKKEFVFRQKRDIIKP